MFFIGARRTRIRLLISSSTWNAYCQSPSLVATLNWCMRMLMLRSFTSFFSMSMYIAFCCSVLSRLLNAFCRPDRSVLQNVLNSCLRLYWSTKSKIFLNVSIYTSSSFWLTRTVSTIDLYPYHTMRSFCLILMRRCFNSGLKLDKIKSELISSLSMFDRPIIRGKSYGGIYVLSIASSFLSR